MNVHAPSTPEPAPPGTIPPSSADEAQRAAIAHAVWTEIHWMMPPGRAVTITVDGDDIAVAFGPCREEP